MRAVDQRHLSLMRRLHDRLTEFGIGFQFVKVRTGERPRLMGRLYIRSRVSKPACTAVGLKFEVRKRPCLPSGSGPLKFEHVSARAKIAPHCFVVDFRPVELSTDQRAFKPLSARAAENPESSWAQLTISGLRFMLISLATGCRLQQVRIRRRDFCVWAVPWYTCKKPLLKRFSKFQIGIVGRGAEHMYLPCSCLLSKSRVTNLSTITRH